MLFGSRVVFTPRKRPSSTLNWEDTGSSFSSRTLAQEDEECPAVVGVADALSQKGVVGVTSEPGLGKLAFMLGVRLRRTPSKGAAWPYQKRFYLGVPSRLPAILTCGPTAA